MDGSISFAYLALASSLKHNRSLQLMEKLNKAIDWSRVENILSSNYSIGSSGEDADAYPPLLLFKCMSFKSGSAPVRSSGPTGQASIPIPSWKTKSTTGCLSKSSWASLWVILRQITPTFSRFRSRLSKNAIDQIHPVTN